MNLQDIGNIADLISILVFHEILLQARQIDCHLPQIIRLGQASE